MSGFRLQAALAGVRIPWTASRHESYLHLVAALGIPYVLVYTATTYWGFRGMVKIAPASC
jgi:hypothetical protein